MLELTDNIAGFKEEVSIYKKHLQSIYELEMFYGDQTLQGLIKHSREMLNNIYDFQTKYFIEGEEEEIDRTEKEKNPEAEEESILYRSSSESDS